MDTAPIPAPYERLNRLVDIASAHLDRPGSAYKHFSFIIKGRKIFSIGWNNTYGTPAKINRRPIIYPLGGVHSEAAAIAKLDDLNICRKSTLVNIRINKHKQLRNSRPCPVCLNLMDAMGFKRIYYTTNLGFELLRL